MFYWTKWLGKLIAMHQPRNPEKDLTRKSEYFSMHVLGAIMILLCLLFPELARQIVNPIVLTLFGQTTEVLSMSELTTMVIMVFSVLIVPAVMFLISRSTHREYVPIYMCGINEGDNTHYTGSLGEPRKLYLDQLVPAFPDGQTAAAEARRDHFSQCAHRHIRAAAGRCVMMIKVVSLLLYLCLAPFAGALLDGVDRKITARMQGRKGPKLLQPFYDLIKLFSKQMIAVNSVQLLLNLSYLAFLAIAGGHLVLRLGIS